MAAGVTNVDLALCGGGLQSGLIVAALCGSGSARTVALAEREGIGGNHTWCFHAGDLSPAMLRHVEPFVAYRWSSYEVRFPGYRRVLDTPYAMISSERLRSEVLRMVADRAGSMACEHTPAEVADAGTVRLADGRTLAARTVIDARGGGGAVAPCGYQKFYGEEITLRRGHGLTRPIVMDATVAQRDGYRFMYVLPLTPTRALVEDTSFSDGPELDEDERRCGIADWLGEHGWEALRVERTERGVLPMPMAEAPEDLPPRRSAAAGPTVMQGGYRGGWFHPGTGYSLPLAAELAELIATTPADALPAAVAAATHERRRRARFCHLLNRLLFRWYPPEARRGIFERFYRLPASTIARYYAMRLRPVDKMRILGGRPPAGLSIPAGHGGRLTQASGNG